MDTLYTCALKRTPSWLAIVVCILPVSEFVVGFATLAAAYVFAQQWVGAIVSFSVVLMLTVNLTTYNVSGCILIRILRKHQQTGVAAAGEDITGSKSASPFDVVIAKTLRSMCFLTLPSLATLLMFFVTGVSSCNSRPLPPYDPNNVTWSVMATLFVQLILGFVFTRVAWVSKAALDAEIAKTVSTEGSPSIDARRSSRAPTRADLKERAKRISQSPNSRPSNDGTLSAQTSHSDVELALSPAPAVAPVAADGCSKTDSSLLVQNEADIV